MTKTETMDPWQIRLRYAMAALAMGLIFMWSGLAHASLAPDTFSTLAKKVSPSVVWIATTQQVQHQAQDMPFNFPKGSPFEKFFRQFRNQQGQGGQPQIIHALGSGFIIDPSGYIVTNNHVIDHATSVQVRLVDGSEYKAKIVGSDQLTDLALLKIKADKPLPAVPFGNSDKAQVGDWVMAVGNPFGLGGTVTAGIISARNRNIQSGPYDDYLQVDAPINKGNSGGPLFNLDGQVIGVNTAIYSPNGGSVGIGFAIPSNIVKPVVAQIREHGQVERGWLGVQIQDVTPEIADAMGLKGHNGALVSQVLPDSPAKGAGLKTGDVIAAVDGKTVEDPQDLARMIAQDPAGSKVKLSVWRDGKEITVAATTGKMPKQDQLAMTNGGNNNQTQNGVYHSKALGADLGELTKQARSDANVPADVNGVIILDVGQGPAMDQGLRPGDVIREVDHTKVTTPTQVEKLVSAAAKKDKSVLMLINRHGRDIFVGLKPGVA